MTFPSNRAQTLLIVLLLGCFMPGMAQRLSSNTGYVHFLSNAPLERIEAESDALQGILDTQTNEFAFSLSIRSFEGFNSGLQREHFNENYMKSEQHPRGTFTGKIVEDIDYGEPGTRHVRAKGKMTIHGVGQERIIKAELTITEEGVKIEADFTVLLSDHQISIPRIVRQKISEEIEVHVRTTLRP